MAYGTFLPQSANKGVWMGRDSFYALSTAPRMAKTYRDSGSTARAAYQASAESACKSAFPGAFKSVGAIGKLPYTQCVRAKMSAYDASVDQAQLNIAMGITEITKTPEAKTPLAKASDATLLGATSVTAVSDRRTLIIGGFTAVVLLFIVFFWFSGGPTTSPAPVIQKQ